MDRETIPERLNRFQREGRRNNKAQGRGKYQRERSDMGADQSETQQITFTAVVESTPISPLQIHPTSIIYTEIAHVGRSNITLN